MIYYEYIDRYTIQLAPRPLRIGDEDVFTNDEKIYNQQGCYRKECDEYPKDEKEYSAWYELVENVIHKRWEEIEEAER